MDFDGRLRTFDPVDHSKLRAAVLDRPQTHWSSDRESRVRLAGNRPGDAVFLFNDAPPFAPRRSLLDEAATVGLSVFVNNNDPLFREVRQVIDSSILPRFPSTNVSRCQIASLPPGATIKTHRDGGILAAIHRVHLPIISTDLCEFVIDDEPVTLDEGTVYELNNVRPHSVTNRGPDTRYHLICDLLPESRGSVRYFSDPDEFLGSLRAG